MIYNLLVHHYYLYRVSSRASSSGGRLRHVGSWACLNPPAVRHQIRVTNDTSQRRIRNESLHIEGAHK